MGAAFKLLVTMKKPSMINTGENNKFFLNFKSRLFGSKPTSCDLAEAPPIKYFVHYWAEAIRSLVYEETMEAKKIFFNYMPRFFRALFENILSRLLSKTNRRQIGESTLAGPNLITGVREKLFRPKTLEFLSSLKNCWQNISKTPAKPINRPTLICVERVIDGSKRSASLLGNRSSKEQLTKKVWFFSCKHFFAK